ncbi:MAG: hypothetical protein DRN92_08725 [Thermoproteota archaeon]|nr:MAG: hypothetical protein DRN92_08725 [Candidatus Korarchaeota archaeon]
MREDIMQDPVARKFNANFFEDMLANAVVETLEEILGSVATGAIIRMIAELNQSSRESALRDPKALHLGLLGLFGKEGKIIERRILQKLRNNVEAQIDVDGDFLEEIEKIGISYFML